MSYPRFLFILMISLAIPAAIGCDFLDQSCPDGTWRPRADEECVPLPSSDAGGGSDAGPIDAGSSDAGAIDAGPSDAGTIDGGSSDGGATDAAAPVDAAADAAAPADAGVDAG